MRILKWFGFTTRDLPRELDEEFEFHIGERARVLRERGLSSADASRAAREAFGDVARYRAESIVSISAIYYRRRMWAVGMATSVVACTLGIAASAAFLSRRDGLAMNSLREDVERLRLELAPFRGEGRIPLAQQVRFVTVRGAVCNPRVWTVPSDLEVSLRAIIAKSGGLTSTASGEVILTSSSSTGSSPKTLTASQWLDPDKSEIPIPGFVTIDVR